MKPIFSLKKKILIFCFILVVVPILGIGTVSFFKSKELIENKYIDTNLSMVRQVSNNIDFVLDDMHYISLFIIQNNEIRRFLNEPMESQNYVPYRLEAQREIMNLLSLKTYIDSISIESIHGDSVQTKSGGVLTEEGKDSLTGLRGKPQWGISFDGSSISYLSLTRSMNDINKITEHLGYIEVSIAEAYISHMAYMNDTRKDSDYLILDKNGLVLSATDKQIIGKPLVLKPPVKTMLKNDEGYYIDNTNGNHFLVTYKRVRRSDWLVINRESIEDLYEDSLLIQKTLIIVSLISICVCVLLLSLFTKNILRPLEKIRELMQDLRHENFDVQIDVRGNDEITLLCRAFNKMSMRLKKTTQEVYMVKIKQREAELKALQAQINPHFLYNTLDTIYWMSTMEKAPESAKLVKALSTLFRLSLNKGNEQTTVLKELEHLKSYILIQEKRYEDQISFLIHSDDDIKDCKVVKLVLQPLVENAIYHGIEKNGGQGNIVVNLYREDNLLVYEIIDDGIGMSREMVRLLLKKSGNNNYGIGLKNVNDRIQLYNSEDFGITIVSTENIGTTIRVTQPYRT